MSVGREKSCTSAHQERWCTEIPAMRIQLASTNEERVNGV